MSQGDTWGRDPRVMATRAVFAAMEAAGKGLLGQAGIGPLDPRLRPWRERARDMFQTAWPQAMGHGLAAEPAGAARLYLLCLSRALAEDGVEAPAGAGPEDEALAAILKEAAP